MGFVDPRLSGVFIPLTKTSLLLISRVGAGVSVTPTIAVTNDHNANLIPEDRVLARSRDYDLLFFRTEPREAAMTAQPRIGDAVIAYGHGGSEDLREARGIVAGLSEDVAARCAGCAEQHVMVFDAEAGGGFSGGPVVDAKSGAVLGITFGYLDGKAGNGGRRMYAYDMTLVLEEMRRLLNPPAPP